jgi:hypothetical protein
MHNVVPITGSGRADDRSNYGKRPAAAVQCSDGLSARRFAADNRELATADGDELLIAVMRNPGLVS